MHTATCYVLALAGVGDVVTDSLCQFQSSLDERAGTNLSVVIVRSSRPTISSYPVLLLLGRQNPFRADIHSTHQLSESLTLLLL